MSTSELPSYEEVIPRLAQINALSRGFVAKTIGNRESGLKQYTANSLSEFRGFDPEIFKTKIVVQLKYDEGSSREISTRVCKPIQAIAEKYGIDLITPNNGDLSSHSTLQIADFPKSTTMQQTVQELIGEGSNLKYLANQLHGIPVPFNSLVLAGSMLYINMDNPTGNETAFGSFFKISNFRNMSRDIFECAPVSLEVPTGKGTYVNVIHSTVGRITRVTNNSNLTAFAEQTYNSIGESLKRSPITAVVGNVFIGTAYEDIVQSGLQESLFRKP